MRTAAILCVFVIFAVLLYGCQDRQAVGPDEAALVAEADRLAREHRQRIEEEARLADEGPPPDTKEGALRRAAEYGNVDETRRLISSGADVNEKDSDGNTALHFVASTGNAAIVRVLLDAGAKVDAQNNSLMTPLHMAVRHPDKERHEVAYVLMAHGANVDSKSIQGLTPVDMAGWGADKELLAYMKRISKRMPVTPESTVALYAKECASCHGVAGEGGAKGPPLKGTSFMGSSSVDEIAYVIRFGRIGTFRKYAKFDADMPMFERLGSEEVRAIAGHIKAFGGAQTGGIQTGSSDPVEEDNSSDEEYNDTGEEGDGGDEYQDEEEGDGGDEEGDGGDEGSSGGDEGASLSTDTPGGVLYSKKCAMCHGKSGEGGAMAPPLKGTGFIRNSSYAEIVNVIRNGRSGANKKYANITIAMPKFDTLSSKELADIVEYLRTL